VSSDVHDLADTRLAAGGRQQYVYCALPILSVLWRGDETFHVDFVALIADVSFVQKKNNKTLPLHRLF
jgi:hypothetical protein